MPVVLLAALLALWALGSRVGVRHWRLVFPSWEDYEAIALQLHWATARVLKLFDLIIKISVIVVLSRCFEVVGHVACALDVNDWSHTRNILSLSKMAHAHLRVSLNLCLISMTN